MNARVAARDVSVTRASERKVRRPERVSSHCAGRIARPSGEGREICMTRSTWIRLVAPTLLAIALPAHATQPGEIGIATFDPRPGDPDLALGSYTHPAGGDTLTLDVGIGSGAFR